MELQIVGVEKASLALREQVSFTDSLKLSFYRMMREKGFDNGVIISTCNRSEVYVFSQNDNLDVLQSMYLQFFHLPQDTPLLSYHGKEAVLHLLEVVSGLASVLIGEDQIFTQVKDAYAFSCHAQMANKAMHVLFQEVFHLAKKVRSTYKLNEQPTSSAYATMKLLKKHVDLQNQRILFCGSGNMIMEMLPYVADRENVHMLLHSEKKRIALQQQYPKLLFHSMEHRKEQWNLADIVITATASPHYLFPYEITCLEAEEKIKAGCKNDHHIESEEIKETCRKDKYIFDLAVPRDVDPRWGNLEHIHLFDIDMIQKQMETYNIQRMTQAKLAKAYIKEQVEGLWKRLNDLQSGPLMEALHQKLLEASDDTYALLNAKLQLSQHEQTVMKKTLDYAFQHYLVQLRELLMAGGADMHTTLSEILMKGES